MSRELALYGLALDQDAPGAPLERRVDALGLREPQQHAEVVGGALADPRQPSVLGCGRLVPRGVVGSLGPEPLWAYWLARETDAKSIRAILIGLRSRPQKEGLDRRLRRPYV